MSHIIWEGDASSSISPDTGQQGGAILFTQNCTDIAHAPAGKLVRVFLLNGSPMNWSAYTARFVPPLLLIFPALNVNAQTSALDSVVVTSTRLQTSSTALISDMVVIDRTTIEQFSSRTLSELLARMAGVQISSNGGFGKNSGVSIRGTESRHAVLLVDGMRYGSATTGGPNWDNIPIEMIERIEVLKGPASALYGSEAVGGVVQIFTRKSEAGFMPNASATVGANAYAQLTAGLTGGENNVSYALGWQRTHDKGFSATNFNEPFGSFNPDRDGFNQTALHASVGWQLAPNWRIDAKTLYSRSVNRFDDGADIGANADTRAHSKSAVMNLALEGRLFQPWETRLNISSSKDHYLQLASSSPYTDIPSRFDTKQDQITWQNNFVTSYGKVIAGLENLKQAVDSTTNFDVTQRTIRSVFVGLHGAFGNHYWQANLRRDDNSQFGGSTTGFAGYGYQLTPKWRANISYGTSFVAPSFNQLYYPYYGNPNLQPERGRNTDVSLAYSNAGQDIKLVYFDNKIRGFISADAIAANIAQTRIKGGTLSYKGNFGPLKLHGSLDKFSPQNVLTGKQLALRADRQLILGVDYVIGALKLGASLLAVGERFENAANTLRMGGYSTVDLYADYAFYKAWSIQTKLVNAADKRYETIRGYNQAGRGIFVTLRFTPK